MNDKTPQASGQADTPSMIEERLRFENAWRATHQRLGADNGEAARCPRRSRPSNDYRPPDCAMLWQNAAREALVGVPA